MLPFSANVFEAQYTIAGPDLLPFSSTSFTQLEFQSFSLNTVGLASGSVITAPEEDVITIRCTRDLNNSQYKYAYIKVAMHTRFLMRF